jgi:hypothetical protein
MDGLLDLKKEIMYAIESLQEINCCGFNVIVIITKKLSSSTYTTI